MQEMQLTHVPTSTQLTYVHPEKNLAGASPKKNVIRRTDLNFFTMVLWNVSSVVVICVYIDVLWRCALTRFAVKIFYADYTFT